ncbi:hypothetical protein [Streptomyces sp. NPDC051569]|uniref:hypothetical protein n=1 Tax=Streptomyces sp. NPDC051569 TaxID=3365661 RepID=UPI0037ADCE60
MRSTARAHLSQLIELFGTDGRLVINTSPDPSSGSPQDSAPDSEDAEDAEAP